MTLIDILDDARARGFSHNLAYDDNELVCAELGKHYDAANSFIVDSKSADAGTDPGDDVTVYFIETGEGDRGYIIVPASIYAEPAKAAFIDRLKTKPKPNADTAAP